MGRIRRGGYIFEWWIGDHPPRHIHVSDDNGKILGHIRLDPIEPVDEWQPSRKVIEIIRSCSEKADYEDVESIKGPVWDGEGRRPPWRTLSSVGGCIRSRFCRWPDLSRAGR